MSFQAISHLCDLDSSQIDLVVLPLFSLEKSSTWAFKEEESTFFQASLSPMLKDHKGKREELLFTYGGEGKISPSTRLLFIGLGKEEKLTAEGLRISYAKVLQWSREKEWTRLALFLPQVGGMNEEEVAYALFEGIQLANYHYTKKREEKKFFSPQVTLVGAENSVAKPLWEKCTQIISGVNVTRELVNENADHVTAPYLGEYAEKLFAERAGVKVEVFDRARVEKEGMHLLLTVNRGSHLEPRFLLISYQGNPSSSDHTVLVGKGVTFDTGGLNLKTTKHIEDMRTDMAGAATVLGTLDAISQLGLKVNVTGVIPATDNPIGSKSYKPGDVYPSHSGKSVEIGNTDAEGRLILADALSYSCKHLEPSRIIDFATLTGAIVIALGERIAGVMSNDSGLVEQLRHAGELSCERVWPLPLCEEYRASIRSTIADVRNTGKRGASSITAALFLQEFVAESIPWAHLDIAGTAYRSQAEEYHSTQATGFGVRLVVQFLSTLEKTQN